MVNQANELPVTTVKRGETSIGDALLNCVSQSLFKNFGRTSAINNDIALKKDLQSQFFTAANGDLAEENNSYTGSKFFRRYLQSGRYADDTTSNFENTVDYNLNDTVFRFILQINGSMTDSDASGTVNLETSENSELVFGTPNETNSNGETQVVQGNYSTRVLVILKHDTRL